MLAVIYMTLNVELKVIWSLKILRQKCNWL